RDCANIFEPSCCPVAGAAAANYKLHRKCVGNVCFAPLMSAEINGANNAIKATFT
ncbi:unnamed protein product, partial [Prorocentrum cordatum]